SPSANCPPGAMSQRWNEAGEKLPEIGYGKLSRLEQFLQTISSRNLAPIRNNSKLLPQSRHRPEIYGAIARDRIHSLLNRPVNQGAFWDEAWPCQIHSN